MFLKNGMFAVYKIISKHSIINNKEKENERLLF